MSTKPRRDWAIIGGGMMGLTLALRLARAGQRVSLYEAAPQLGGLASAWTLGDITWDRHYHVTLLSDLRTRGVLRDLGLEQEMRWVETKTGFYAGGKLASMSNAVEYLSLPGLSLIDKVRVGGTILYGSRIHDWRTLEETRVDDWLVGLSGRSAFDRLWRPLLESKLGSAWRQASAAFIWATIQRLYAARRTGLKKEMFGYVPGGYARIMARFGEQLQADGVSIRLGQPISRIRRSGAGLAVETELGSTEHERVVITATPSAVARTCPELASEERERFENVPYQGIVCASMLLEQPLAGYYLTYLTDPGLPFTAVVEMSSFVDRAEFGGRTLVYLPRYAPADDEAFSWTDDEVERRFLDAMKRTYPAFASNRVLAFRVSRVREVFPLPRIGYSRRLPPIATSVPGLLAVNSAHIVNGTLNVNDTVAIAERAAESLLFSDGRHAYLD